MQVLQRSWDGTFSEHSHGFRSQRWAHQAVAKAQQSIAAGSRWVVDLDLEKFFDRVNHHQLMAAIARQVSDKRMLKLIRAILESGGMEERAGGVRWMKELRKAGLGHRCCGISCSTNSTRSWSGASTAACATRMIAISRCEQRAGKRVMQSVGLDPAGDSSSRSMPRRARWLDRRIASSWASASPAGENRNGASRPRLAPLQAQGAGTKATNTGHQSGADDQATGQLFTRMEELLRLQPDALGTAKARGRDATQVAIHDLEAMEAQHGAVYSATPTEHPPALAAQTAGRPHGPWVWPTVRLCSPPSDCLLRCPRRFTSGCCETRTTNIRRMRTDVRWCGRYSG